MSRHTRPVSSSSTWGGRTRGRCRQRTVATTLLSEERVYVADEIRERVQTVNMSAYLGKRTSSQWQGVPHQKVPWQRREESSVVRVLNDRERYTEE